MADINGKISLKGQMNGQSGRPTKEAYIMKTTQDTPCDFQGCPGVQYCTVQAKCKKACDKSKSLCSGGKCGNGGTF